MKILYSRLMIGQDYLADCVFHGLRQIPGVEVVDAPRNWAMYKSSFEPVGMNKLSDIYGRGFTIWGLLDDPEIDRTNIEEKIKNHYFDLVIFSRVDHHSPYKDLVLQYYKKHEIVSLDGADDTVMHTELIPTTTYFKRELIQDTADVKPISFSIPAEKCITKFPNKTQAWSYVQPTVGCRYIYNTESDYYADYAKSLFGLTRKKGGWDCMRHYEIMANRCIPYFEDLAHAPPTLMKTLPKDLLLHIKGRVDQMGIEYFLPDNPGWLEYQHLEQTVHNHFIKYLTTQAVAQSLLNSVIQP